MSATGGWQTGVNTVPAPGVEGDFCDSNPRYTVDAGPGGLVCGDFGVTVGRFAWLSYESIDADNAPALVNNFGSGSPAGFVHREQQGLITLYLGDATLVVPKGFPITLFAGGGFFVKNNGLTQALYGMKAYADLATGKVSFAPPNSPGSASVTGAISAGAATVNGSIQNNTLTVNNAAAGTVLSGALLFGTVGASGVTAGTTVVSQLSGASIGGTGTYAVTNPEQLVGPGSLSLSWGVLNVTNVASGSIEVGASVSGSGVTAGSAITALGTGTGGLGTYIVNFTQSAGSEALTIGSSVETRFFASSSGLPGELVKMTDRLTA
jgi:hypothetical protein